MFADVGGSGIDVTLSTGKDFIITLRNLVSGASYRLLSYHSRTDEDDTTIPGVTITGGTPISVPASIVQTHAIMDDPAECVFTAGAGDVSIRYLAPVGGCDGCQAFLNGFVLEYVGPAISFSTDASGGIESISPALVEVKLTNPVGGATYMVDYAATGGTAAPADDYNLTPDTLVFNPGDTSKFIRIEIISDEELEEDETIILDLFNATGPDVMLGIWQHTYVISDLAPNVLFDSATSSGLESSSPAMIKVKLSHAGDDTVTVNYGVTGGTATNGADYSVVGSVLTFVPGDVTEYIGINVVDDTETESEETIQLTLSGPTNATVGTPAQHTYSILDNEQGVYFDGLIWYYSDSSNPLYVTPENQLVWVPEKPEQITARLPEQRLSTVDDVVEFSYWWMTDGEGHESHPECVATCQTCSCNFDDDIECMAGTGDFRVGLFEADGEYVTEDGLGTSNSIFSGYKGYNFKMGPNMDRLPERWNEECDGGENHIAGGFHWRDNIADDSLLGVNNTWNRLSIYGGFELPLGEWSLWTIRLERISSSRVDMWITLNDITYYEIDDESGSKQPQKIDVVALQFPNGRPYSIWTIEPVPPPPPPCKNLAGDPIIDWHDMQALLDYWITSCSIGEWCDGRDINEDGAVTMPDFTCLAYWWMQPCPPQ
jgi:hypothetical protein